MAPHHKREKGDNHGSHHFDESVEATVPWIQSPMETWDKKSQSFAPRHEASTIELFFDLFFVANLATFTQYHAITSSATFWSYVAFFAILWMTWFHVVCIDARFSSDSVWERACKVVQFCVFAVLALVGYKFNLLSSSTPNWIYELLCWGLLISRLWLALQYLITAIFCSSRRNRHLRLTLPLLLNTGVFVVAAVVFGSLVVIPDDKPGIRGFIIGLFVVMLFELVGTLGVSCLWTKLSFRATHIGERLGLLGLIIIGEGVLGTTKTITRIMGKNGVYFEGCGLIFSIIMILLFMWILYFDNLPRYRFGPIKQQFWMALHLPLHLAILGVVEGSQQIALARNVYYSSGILAKRVYHSCVLAHLDGRELATNLTKTIALFKLNETAQSNQSLPLIYNEIYFLGNQSGVCSPANSTDLKNGMDGINVAFIEFFERAFGGMFQSFGLDIPAEGQVYGIEIAAHSWRVVYAYYWSAILLLFLCLTVAALLAERGLYFARFKLVALLCRTAMTILTIVLLNLGLRNPKFLDNFIGSAWVLPTVVLMFWIICWGDKISKWGLTRKQKKQQGQETYDRVGGREEGEAEAEGDEESNLEHRADSIGYAGYRDPRA